MNRSSFLLVLRGEKWDGASNDTAKTEAPSHSKCGVIKIPPCSKIISDEHRPKFYSLHRQWRRLHMSGTLNNMQTNQVGNDRNDLEDDSYIIRLGFMLKMLCNM